MVLHKVSSIFLFVVLLLFSFQRGLFNGGQAEFEKPIYVWLAIIFLSFPIIASATMFRRNWYEDRLTVVHLVAYALPICYGLAAISPASAHYSEVLVWIQFAYAACLMIAMLLSREANGARLLVVSIQSFAYAIVVFGLANWFGDAAFWGLFDWGSNGFPSTVYTHAVLNQGLDARLTSIFQYPNTYAALLMGIAISTVLSMVYARSAWGFGIHALLLVPVLVSFILTGSRGAFVLFPILIVLVLPFITLTRQLSFIFYLLVAGIVSMSVSGPIFDSGIVLQSAFSGGEAFRMWLLLIGASAGTVAVTYLYFRFATERLAQRIKRWNNARFSNIHLPAVSVLFGILMGILLLGNTGFTQVLPENIRLRLEAINVNQNSVLERGTFYQDALKLWRDYPVIGTGGGGWAALYEKYQNNPYTSRQAHNFYLQTLVETGILGLSALLLLLAVVLYHFLRSYRTKSEEDRLPYLIGFVIAASILLHSFLDFNMSFVLIGMIVFLCLGIMLGGTTLPPFSFQKGWARRKALLAYPSILAGVSAICFIATTVFSVGASQYGEAREQAIRGGAPFDQIMRTLDSAIAKQGHPEYVDLKLQLLIQAYAQTSDPKYRDEAQQLVSRWNQKEPNYRSFLFRELSILQLDQQYEQAIQLLESAIPKYPWEMRVYENLAAFYFMAGLEHAAKDSDAAREQWQHAFEVENRVLTKARELENLPDAQTQGREFGLTPDLAFPLGQILYFQGQYAKAATYLQNKLDGSFNDAKDYEAGLFYLASLKKQSQDDAALFESMMTSHQQPETLEERLEEILSHQPIP